MGIASIGVGGWGRNHVRVLSQLGKLTAVCDLNADLSKQYGATYKVNNYTSISEMTKNEDIQGAVVCTPTSTHFKVASELIKQGIHVFVEKPLTYHSKDGEDLIKLAEKNNVKLTCGYIERFNPAVSLVKDKVRSKEHGDLLMLEFHRENRMPLHIKDVGIIYDTSVHDIDTALWLFDDTPQQVFAKSGQNRHEHEDFATLMLSFSNNRIAIITSNWITPARVRTFNAVFTEAKITSDFISQDIKIEMEEGTFVPRNPKQEPLFLEIKNFVDAIYNGTAQVVTSREAVNVTKIAEAALKSSEIGQPISIEF